MVSTSSLFCACGIAIRECPHALLHVQVVSGSVDVGQPLLLRPANDRAVVKALYSLASAATTSGGSGAPKAYAEAGDGVSREGSCA